MAVTVSPRREEKKSGVKRRYRLLEGKHVEQEFQGDTTMYSRGDVIESEENLLQFNAPGYPPKFAAVEDGWQPSETTWNPEKETIEQFALRMRDRGLPAAPPAAPPVETPLSSMTLVQLQAVAAEEELELAPEVLIDRVKLEAALMEALGVKNNK